MEKKKQFRSSLYVPGKLHELLKKEAEKQHRTVSNLIQKVLIEYLKQPK